MTRRERKELAKQNQTKKKKFKISVFKIKTISIIAVSLLFLVAVGFFIDSFAPANPKCYHKWVLSTFHGSYDSEDGPKTYMQLETKKIIETSERATSYVWSKVTVTESAGVNEIWLNVSDLYEDEAIIEIRNGNSGSSSTVFLSEYKLTKKELKESKDGWIKIYDVDKGDKANASSSSPTFAIGFKTKLRLREIGFVGNGGFEVTIEECGTATNNVVDAITSSTKGSEVEKIFDENHTFPYAPKTEY